MEQLAPCSSLAVLQQHQELLARWAAPRGVQQQLGGLLRSAVQHLQEQQGVGRWALGLCCCCVLLCAAVC